VRTDEYKKNQFRRKYNSRIKLKRIQTAKIIHGINQYMKAKGCLAESRELNCCEEVYCYFVTAFEAIKIHMLA
jgi:hypothetical protein